MSIVRTIQRPINLRVMRLARGGPRIIKMITADAVILTVATAAARKFGSAKTWPYSANPTNLFDPGVRVFQPRRLYQTVTTNGTCVTTIMKINAGRRGSRRTHAWWRDGA